MTRGPTGAVFCVALAAIWIGPAYPAQLTVQQATLYVAAPAEVQAAFRPEGQTADLDLPGGLLPDSLQAAQGEAALSPSLQPVYKPQQGLTPPQVDRYRAQLTNLRAGQEVHLSFRTNGLQWNPAGTLDVSGDRGRLEVLASITNDALDLTGVHLRLVSGYVGRGGETASPFGDDPEFVSYLEMLREAGRAQAASAGGLHLAMELDAVDIPRGSRRPVPFVSSDVTVAGSYRWDTYPPGGEEGMPAGAQRAHALYSFVNVASRPLPDGKVTVTEGGAVVGTGYAAWTPPGEMALVAVAGVQGLTVRRSEEATPRPKTWETQRTTKLRLENSRDAKVTVRVLEHRRGLWGYEGYDDEDSQLVYEFSQPPQTGTKGAFVWDVAVPAHGDATVTYSYREPVDLTPLRLIAFDADDSPKERAYLVEAPTTLVATGQGGGSYRQVQPGGFIVYRLPVPAGVTKADLDMRLGNAFRISLAPEVDGKPGGYTVAADATAIAGRVVRDSANRSTLTFGLSPFISDTSRGVYVRMDDPELASGGAGGAWVGWLSMTRIPEGFSSRAPNYAVGEQAIATGVAAGKEIAAATPASAPTRPAVTPAPPAPAPAALAAQRQVLAAFSPYTRQEEDAIYYENGTGHYADGRGVSYDAQLIYAFKIPPEVSAADCVVTVDNMFLVRVARDDGGKPGEWHVELDAAKLFGRKIRDSENRMEYTVDITPYLKDNPSRTVYVSFRPTEFYEAETGVYHVEVVALDDAERARIGKRQRRLDFFIQQDGDGHLLVFQADGNPTELSYLYGAQNPPPGPYGRGVEGNDSLTYRLPLTRKMAGCQIRALVDNTFVVSLALERNGKPGQFREAVRGAARMSIGITPAMIAAGAVYLKFEYSRPGDPGGIVVKEISIRQP
jgi:hypothetical protein